MEYPKRKPTRLQGYSYDTPGAYFITVCAHNRKQLFSHIVGAIHESPENTLSDYGRIVEEIIAQIPQRFQIKIDKYVIMPNHIHLLIMIENDAARAIRESPLRGHRFLIDKVIGYMKMNASKRIHKTYKDKIWQRSYHDHIIRDENDYRRIWSYIDTNVIRWEMDCFYDKNDRSE